MVLPAILLFFLLSVSPVFAQTPTPVTNPDSGVYLSEIMPAPPDNQEWAEIYNSNDFPVILENWQFDDIESGGGSPKSLAIINISASSFYIIEIGGGYLNNSSDSARLINQNGDQTDIFSYTTYSSTQSWSKQLDNSWCLVGPSKNSTNNTCSPPTPSPSPPPSLSPDPPTPTPTIQVDPNIIINSWPSSADLGQNFTLTFTLDNIEPQTEYYIKAYEDSDTDKSLEVLVNDSWQSSYKGATWSSMPKFSSDNSTISQDLHLRAKSDKNSGDYQIYLKAMQVFEDTIGETYLSSSKTVSVNSADTPSTNTPTLSLTASATTSPSISPAASPSPSPSPVPSPTPAGIDTIPDQSDPSILGDQDSVPTSSPKKSISAPANLIPKIFIGLGTLFLLVPTLITKIKRC